MIRKKVRECECGYVRGKYKSNGRHALTNGNGMSIALSNASLLAAMHKPGEIELDAWKRPNQGPKNPHTNTEPTL